VCIKTTRRASPSRWSVGGFQARELAPLWIWKSYGRGALGGVGVMTPPEVYKSKRTGRRWEAVPRPHALPAAPLGPLTASDPTTTRLGRTQISLYGPGNQRPPPPRPIVPRGVTAP